MGKPSTKCRVSKITHSTKKSSLKLITASTGKTSQKLQGATIVKTPTITHSRSLSTAKTGQNSMSMHSNSASKLAASSEVSDKAGMGSMLVAHQSPHSKARSGKKVTSCKSASTVTCLPPHSLRMQGWSNQFQFHQEPSTSQLIFYRITGKFLIICWAAQAQGLWLFNTP